ncbi:Holliday junction resolvase RuvX [Candidatus Gracilibacteria bacterium]|nr:Holliday junction resolvase RuvX [Candidatus Gracilibacteria bacterium]MCF7856274.1 Holliday junction resolvase RuvX [Candidatus Gracilibacteria bacterium]MCF7896247.1 Holliday junction resolvase RuvX [Candidatus Gracilibacteria bacterium]
MKILALDFGGRRVGVAFGDSEIGVAAARNFLVNNSDLLDNLAELVEQDKIEKILVGLPLGFSGETRQTNSTRDFVKKLEAKVAVAIELVDERFTSKIAETNLHAAGENSRQQKTLVDSESARIILQEYLDSKLTPRYLGDSNN